MKYWDRVKVTSWFYEGMEGIVKMELSKLVFRKREYVVEVELPWFTISPTTTHIIPESNLEIIN